MTPHANHPASWADDVIDMLASLPGFPPARERLARALLARRLEGIFQCTEMTMPPAAAPLLLEMMDLDKWPGPATFFAMARRLAKPVEVPEYSSADIPHLRDYLPKPDGLPDCDQCNGLGYRVRAGVFVRCECLCGDALEEKFLELLNARTDKARGPQELKRVAIMGDVRDSSAFTVTRLISEADIRDAVHLRQVQKALNDPEFSTGGIL